jgi:hypothetical protein
VTRGAISATLFLRDGKTLPTDGPFADTKEQPLERVFRASARSCSFGLRARSEALRWIDAEAHATGRRASEGDL